MQRHVLFAGLVLLGASGCVSVTGPRAIRPGRAGIALGFEPVDTLSPLLEWEPTSEADAPARVKAVSAASAPEAPAVAAPAREGPPLAASNPSTATAPAPAGDGSILYDVAIHEVVRVDAWRNRPGTLAYYREGIAGTSHHVEVSLDPGRKYYWFVRARRANLVGPWSRFGYFLFFGVGWMSASNQPYRFRTPGAEPAAEPAQEGATRATGAGAVGGAGASAPGGAGSGPPSYYQ